MAGVPIKFRCFRCHQLLGVARSKAGAVVACPKCSAELVVPEPDDAAPAPAPAPTEGPPGVRTGVLDTGLSLDFLDIRPEDIRVQPGVTFHPPAEPEPLAPEPSQDAESFPPPGSPADPFPAPNPSPSPVPPPAERHQPTSPPTPAVSGLADEEDAAAVAAVVQFDTPRVRPEHRPPPPRPRDLVVPRSLVAAWSLFVILALGFAFLAGLLAGHYVWRLH